MHKLMLICAALAIACGARAADVWEGSLTIAASGTAATNTIDLANSGTVIDSIIVYNSGDTNAAVTIAAADHGVYTTVDTFTPAAAGGEIQYPQRPVLSYSGQNITTGTVFFVKSNINTNYVSFIAKQLRTIVTRGVTNTAATISVRVYGH